ncbi:MULTISPECIES: TrbI/VirB10 family protein [unclassified Anabaena]|uniref:TrbI/VirB10 family protein n=1 Tax=unclassified Anabaena TaxID=2619674 RepID=UPI0039C5C3B7
MTSYSIQSELTAQNFIQPIADTYQPEVDSLDWESRMARLVGFQEEAPKVKVNEVEEAVSEQPPEPQPQEIATQQPLSSNPFAKLLLVAGATLSVVLVAGLFLSQMMNSSNQRPSSNNLASSTAPSPPISEPRQQNLEQEIETLKTKLALAEQSQAITAAQQNLRNRPATRVETARVNTPSPTVTRIPIPVQTAAAPRVVERVVERPYSVPPTLPPIAVAPTPAPAPLPAPVPTPPATPPSPPDPLEEWTRLAKLGSYGQVAVTGQSSVQAARNTPENIPPNNSHNAETQPNNYNPEPPPQQESLISQAQSANSKSVKAGTSAKAVLATAVFGETTRARNNEADESANIFVLQLKEPLKNADGEVVLPTNTELLAEINSISEQGLLRLNVVKVISQENGELTERSLPSNALIVRAPQGRPLVADKFPDKGSSIAGMDAGLFVLGGIGKAAELFNRTDSQVVINNGGSTQVTSSNPQRNLAAGIVEGGLNSVVPQISQRNQQAISQMMQQTNVWYIPAGKEVEIYVNRMMQF